MRLVALAALLLGASCDQAPAHFPKTEWQRSEAPDGSLLFRETAEFPLPSSLTRCWRVGGAFDCLRRSQYGSDGHLIQRFTAAQEPSADYSVTDTGYSCAIVGGIIDHTEMIGRDGQTLVSNSPDNLRGGAPWPKSYVEGFVRDNHLEMRTTYFDCAKVADAIHSGSVETLTTTAVSREMLN